MISRTELAEPFREDDKRRAEHAEWMARRDRLASPSVPETNSPGIIYRTYDNGALEPALAADGEASDEETDEVPLGYAVNVFADEVVKRFDYEERQRERLEREINFLKGQLDVALKALGLGPSPSDDDRVVDLPRGFIRKRTDNSAQ